MIPEKLCNRCYKKKPVSEFYVNKKAEKILSKTFSLRDRKSAKKYSHWCKECEKERQRLKYKLEAEREG